MTPDSEAGRILVSFIAMGIVAGFFGVISFLCNLRQKDSPEEKK